AIAIAAVIPGALLAAPPARADGIALSVFAPTPATAGEGFALQSPEIGASGSWVANAVVSYASNPLVLDALSNGSRVSNPLVQSSTLMQIGLAYALFSRLELGAHLPIYQQSGEAAADAEQTGIKPARGTATGNLALHLKARLMRTEGAAGSIALGASALGTLPTASKDQFTGADQPEGRLLALASFTPAVLDARLTLSVNAGAVIRKRSEYANVVQKSGAAWGGGLSVRILDELWATAELFGETTPSGERQEPRPGAMPTPVTLSQIEGLAGFTLKPDRRVSFGMAVGRGMTNAIGTPGLRGVVTLSIVPGAAALAPIHAQLPDGDADHDGIPDSVDKCPHEPEDLDGFQDADGCPDPDNDKDGIFDAQDKCPDEPEDKDGFQDEDGCPDLDNDKDGIPDDKDKCPNEPEDKDGFQDADGCPDPDNDHDGIPDEKDKCPTAPETINGFQDDDGCPDKGDSTIILSPDKIETLDPIQFTGVKLARSATPLIEQVGATLRAHPEILRVRITVHVQPTGNPDADQARTDKRAQAVRDWLIQWGIVPTRLDARGFGGTKPLVPPDQRGAAKLNDRIEFIILERN
ncbi:MAG TPA: OmpA family protein, partial [Kofleriaceae bacterium]|nr:OmpA family protein [Kofleriaceae bacterium]